MFNIVVSKLVHNYEGIEVVATLKHLKSRVIGAKEKYKKTIYTS